MSIALHSKGLLIVFISSFSFPQDIKSVMDSLQDNWELCQHINNKRYCGANPNRLNCNYQIKFSEDTFILYKEFKKIDTGKLKVEYHYDQIFFINFHTSLNDKIFEVLGSDTIKLFAQKENGFILFAELTSTIYPLKKTQHYLEN